MTQIPDHLDCVYQGWQPLLKRAHEKLVVIHPEYNVLQVKEKFGGLRVYLGGTPHELFEQVDAVVREAEHEAYRTCEKCGLPGELRRKKTGWYVTGCETCWPDSVVMED